MLLPRPGVTPLYHGKIPEVVMTYLDSSRRDPRLVQLVRLLTRQAADEYFDAALAKRENGAAK